MRKKTLILNLLIFTSLFSIDQLTKYLAINGFLNKYRLPFISLNILINRGISLGFFDSDNKYVFFFITFIVIIVSLILITQIKDKISIGSPIIGEVLILAGALSNLADRFLHNGVIDFLIFPMFNFSWPGIFNLADVGILLGTFISILTSFE